MNEPIISNSGLSFEKNLLFEHILKNGTTDPITREIISPNLFI